jgi:flagellar assembly protein FliH
MLSSNQRILKAHAVILDEDNKVIIDASMSDEEIEAAGQKEAAYTESRQKINPEDQAQSIIAEANRKAHACIKDAQDEAEQALQAAKAQARAEGEAILKEMREQGYQEGLSKAEQEGEAIRAQAQQALDEAVAEREAMEQALEPDMVDLVIGIAQKLLGDTVKLNPQVIVFLIKQGLSGTTFSGDVTIHVSAHDFETVTGHKDKLLALADGAVRLEILKDLSLNAMDCVIETPYGNIDCSLGQQLESLCANLTHLTQHA